MVIVVLRREVNGAGDGGSEQRRGRVTSVGYDVLHNRASTGGFTPDGDLPRRAAEFMDLIQIVNICGCVERGLRTYVLLYPLQSKLLVNWIERQI